MFSEGCHFPGLLPQISQTGCTQQKCLLSHLWNQKTNVRICAFFESPKDWPFLPPLVCDSIISICYHRPFSWLSLDSLLFFLEELHPLCLYSLWDTYTCNSLPQPTPFPINNTSTKSQVLGGFDFRTGAEPATEFRIQLIVILEPCKVEDMRKKCWKTVM